MESTIKLSQSLKFGGDLVITTVELSVKCQNDVNILTPGVVGLRHMNSYDMKGLRIPYNTLSGAPFTNMD